MSFSSLLARFFSSPSLAHYFLSLAFIVYLSLFSFLRSFLNPLPPFITSSHSRRSFCFFSNTHAHNNRHAKYNVEPGNTVAQVKDCDEEKVLSEYNIVAGSKLHMVLQLRGGGGA
jgi:hypothetical protein